MRPKLKVLCVIGTRPEAIKMAPLVLAMRRTESEFCPVVCVTGQHNEMLSQVLTVFAVEPDHNLRVMTQNQTLAEITARIIEGVDRVLAAEKPDLVMVQGDTTSAFVAALGAFYRRIPIAHIEAGLRTGDLESPFPEEGNRVLIDRLAAYCFAPTERNRKTLLREGIPAHSVYVTGNTGIDALLFVRGRLRGRSVSALDQFWGSAAPVMRNGTKIVLITAHRRESFGEPLRNIFETIRRLAAKHSEWAFVYPVHLNPNVRAPAGECLTGLKNVHLLEPLPYEPFVYLMDRSSIILTDSGGIQEEAPSLGKPVIVMREKTERVEALESGTVMLAGDTGTHLEAAVDRIIGEETLRTSPRQIFNPYGDGHAAERILAILSQSLLEKRS